MFEGSVVYRTHSLSDTTKQTINKTYHIYHLNNQRWNCTFAKVVSNDKADGVEKRINEESCCKNYRGSAVRWTGTSCKQKWLLLILPCCIKDGAYNPTNRRQKSMTTTSWEAHEPLWIQTWSVKHGTVSSFRSFLQICIKQVFVIASERCKVTCMIRSTPILWENISLTV